MFTRHVIMQLKPDSELLIMHEDEILGVISRAGAATGSAGGGGKKGNK